MVFRGLKSDAESAGGSNPSIHSKALRSDGFRSDSKNAEESAMKNLSG
jgi:hypothetical protein